MAEIVRMPKMSDTMTEGVIAAWHKKVGDTIKSGDIVAEVETDKATMDLEAYESGTILYIGVAQGQAVPIDGVLYIVGKAGEDYQALLQEEQGSNTASAKAATQESKPQSVATTATATADTSQIKATVERMPKMSDTMTEGVVVAWHKKVGDSVKSGELLAEIETDKAVMELEAYQSGTILYLGVETGGSVAVDDVLYVVGEAGADYKALLQASQSASSTAEKPQEATPQVQNIAPAQSSNGSSQEQGRLKVSPLAKKMATELGYDLSLIKGSGDGGRIVKQDIENYQPAIQPQAQPATTAVGGSKESASVSTGSNFIGESYEEVAVSQMRKTIARRLSESKFSAPHFYLTIEIVMDNAMEARKKMNEFSPVKISFNDMVIRAAAAALKQHPKVNASWLGDKIRYNHHVHIGVAVAVDEGLLVPVVRFADMKPLSQIAAEVKDLGQKAKNKQLQPKDWEGNTFTISNLGMFGIDEFTAIINPPDACILAVGGIKETALVKDGQLAIGNVMKVTLSCDHRVVDGALGAAFLQTLKANLEDPIRMLV
jgi:pyruvate dehydrogenase E2 component (dihydrolipoamide acetyltransferase)